MDDLFRPPAPATPPPPSGPIHPRSGMRDTLRRVFAPIGGARPVAREVRGEGQVPAAARLQGQVPDDGRVDDRLDRGLHPALGLALRGPLRRAPVRPRARARDRPASRGNRDEPHPVRAVPRRRDRDAGHAAQRVGRGEGRPRRPGARLGRCRRRARPGAPHGLAAARGRRVHRLLPEPLQPAARRAARRWPRRRRAAPRGLARGHRRSRRARRLAPEPDPLPVPAHRRARGVEAPTGLACGRSGDRRVLRRHAEPADRRCGDLPRARSAARGRHGAVARQRSRYPTAPAAPRGSRPSAAWRPCRRCRRCPRGCSASGTSTS